VAPEAPVILAPGDGAVINNVSPVVSGTGDEIGNEITISVTGVENTDTDGFEAQCVTTVTDDEAWSWTCEAFELENDGLYSVTVTETDAAGNSASADSTFTLDTVPPAAPVIVSPTNGLVTNNVSPSVHGTGDEPGNVLKIVVTGADEFKAECATEVQTDGTWSWTCSPQLVLSGEGAYTVTVTETDVAGNTATESVTFTLDTVPPAAPVILAPANGSSTNSASPAVHGTGDEAGNAITITVTGATRFTAT